MQIAIPQDGKIRTILRTSFLIAKREDATTYSLSGESLQMSGITANHVLIFPDSVDVQTNQKVSPELLAQAQPLEMFIALNAEDALTEALGLVLRTAVADGRITDEELLKIAPAQEGRLWQPGLTVAVGDVYTYGACLWRCIAAHTTQGDWPPDLTPALWRKVEVIPDGAVRVWQAGVDYALGDAVFYPNDKGDEYECITAHLSQEGWEPPNTPALWAKKEN